MRYADNNCTYTKQSDPEHALVFTGPYIIGGGTRTVVVPIRQLNAYRRRESIEVAFEGMSLDDREFLITGLPPGFWDSLEQQDGTNVQM